MRQLLIIRSPHFYDIFVRNDWTSLGNKSVAVIVKHRLSPKIGKLTEIADLPKLDREELVEKWRILYGQEPPGGAKNNFLMHAIAYRIQEKVLGGLN